MSRKPKTVPTPVSLTLGSVISVAVAVAIVGFVIEFVKQTDPNLADPEHTEPKPVAPDGPNLTIT